MHLFQSFLSLYIPFRKIAANLKDDKKRRGTGTSSRTIEGDNDDVVNDKRTAQKMSQKAVEAMKKSKRRKHTTLSCKIYKYFDELS
jgi:hypothetical protein